MKKGSKDEDADIKNFQESVMKFTDSLIASTSAQSESIQVWEPKTLAPYQPIGDSKFVAGQETLQLSSLNYIWAAHSNKNIMCVWRWDKKEPLLRFPLKD